MITRIALEAVLDRVAVHAVTGALNAAKVIRRITPKALLAVLHAFTTPSAGVPDA